MLDHVLNWPGTISTSRNLQGGAVTYFRPAEYTQDGVRMSGQVEFVVSFTADQGEITALTIRDVGSDITVHVGDTSLLAAEPALLLLVEQVKAAARQV